MYLLDTNVISELRRPHLNPAVAAWATSSIEEGHFISVVTVLEVQYGILNLMRRDPAQGAIFERWLNDTILPAFAGRTIPISTEIALICARLHVPVRQPERDAWIAATAIARGLAVVTRNVRDFEPMGVNVINPWAT